MKKCCIFEIEESKFKENKDFELVKDYGEIASPNECKRKSMKCKNCGALFLFQVLI